MPEKRSELLQQTGQIGQIIHFSEILGKMYILIMPDYTFFRYFEKMYNFCLPGARFMVQPAKKAFLSHTECKKITAILYIF